MYKNYMIFNGKKKKFHKKVNKQELYTSII